MPYTLKLFKIVEIKKAPLKVELQSDVHGKIVRISGKQVRGKVEVKPSNGKGVRGRKSFFVEASMLVSFNKKRNNNRG